MLLLALIADFLTQNPLFILAFLFWVVSGWSSSYVLLRLVRAGYATDYFATGKMLMSLPRAYLRVRTGHGWPAWPAHFIWISTIVGLASFAVGLFRLLP